MAAKSRNTPQAQMPHDQHTRLFRHTCIIRITSTQIIAIANSNRISMEQLAIAVSIARRKLRRSRWHCTRIQSTKRASESSFSMY
jgi:hypothetical protein